MKFNSLTTITLGSLLLATVVQSHAIAATLIAIPNQEAATLINAELGTIIQLPSPVKTVTPARYFKIRDVTSGGPEGGRTDVRTFHITPIPGAKSESVTFVLASGKGLSLKLVTTPGAEKFLDVQFDVATKKPRDGKFLATEMLLMRALLLDESAGFAKESMDQTIDSPFDALHLTMIRVFAAEGLTGYVFRAQNKTSHRLELHPSSLGWGTPNRAILSQADRLDLAPCSLLSREPECETTLRLVIRGPKDPSPLLLQETSTSIPFVKPSQAGPGAGGAL